MNALSNTVGTIYLDTYKSVNKFSTLGCVKVDSKMWVYWESFSSTVWKMSVLCFFHNVMTLLCDQCDWYIILQSCLNMKDICKRYVCTSLRFVKSFDHSVTSNDRHSDSNDRWFHCLSIFFSCGYQRNHQSSTLLAFFRGIHWWQVDSPHKGPVTRKTSPCDDVIMLSGFMRHVYQYLSEIVWLPTMTSSNENIFRVTGPLCWEFTGHRWIPLTKASDAKLRWFPWSPSEKNDRANNREAGDSRRHCAHYDATVMPSASEISQNDIDQTGMHHSRSNGEPWA